MSRLEQIIVVVTSLGLLVFVPIALWTLTQPDLRLEMHHWSQPIGFTLAPLSLLTVAFLLNDFYKRPLQNKRTWVVALFVKGPIAMLVYIFKHAVHPRTANSRV